MTNKERDKRIKLLKSLSDEQLIDELRRRRNAGPDYNLAWIHKDAFYRGLEEEAEKIGREAQKEQEAKQKELKEKLKTDK